MQTDLGVPPAETAPREGIPTPAPDPAVRATHSRLGIVSLVASLIAGALLALAIGYEIAIVYLFDESYIPSDTLLASLLITATALVFFALGLGIGGLCQSGRRKLFSILGTFSSALISVAVVISLVMTVVVYVGL